MIYRDGEKWDAWQPLLGKNFKLTKDPEFLLSDHHKHLKEVSPGKYVPVYCPMLIIQPTYEWIDEKGQTHEIRYVEKTGNNFTRKNGVQNNQPINFYPEVLEFVDGYLRFNKNKLDLFWFLLNHPDNEMNPIYEKAEVKLLHSKPFVFKYKDANREADLLLAKEDVITRAILTASQLTTEQMRQVYMVLNPTADPNASDKTVQIFIKSTARTSPDAFLAAAKDDESQFESIVKEAVAFGIIKYQKEVRYWRFQEGNTDSFCPVARGENEVKAMVKYLRKSDSDGSTLNLMKERIADKRKSSEE